MFKPLVECQFWKKTFLGQQENLNMVWILDIMELLLIRIGYITINI